MKFYGDELRLKVVESRRKGFKYSEIAEMFSISIISAMRYVKLYKETGSVSKKVRIYKRIVSNDAIMEYMQNNRDALQRDVAKHFGVRDC
jgi:transposase